MSDLEERLRSWFAGEVDRAERDLATSRASTVRVHRRRPIPGLALAGLLVALVVLAVAVRPNVAPDTGKGPVRSPTSGPASPGSPVPSGALVVFGPDGIPTMVDGQEVMTPGEAVAHARTETTDRPFLVGGWYRSWPTGFGCLPHSGTLTDWRLLVREDGCAFFSIDSSERADRDTEGAFAAIETGTALEVVSGAREWGPLVAQVHVHDRRAVDCPERSRAECEAMAVIDAVLWRPPNYANGIPREIAGEPVVLVDKAYGPLTSPDGPQRMLVGGWYSDNPIPCPSQPGAEVSPLIPRCNGAQLSETLEPGGLTIVLIPNRTDIPRGRVVLRVHTGDPQAASCPTTVQDVCERAIVVDEVVWREPLAPIAGRFPDGIPMAIDGEPVIRAADARAVADARTDSTPILVGGWSSQQPPYSCPPPMDRHWLSWGCGLRKVGERPATGTLAFGPGPEIPDGPVIIEVHVHDSGASECLPENRARCEMTIVVDRVAWAGDEVTNTEPLLIHHVVMALRTDIAGFTVEVAEIDRRGCDPGWPEISWVTRSATGIGTVLVFASIAAREAVDQNFGPTGWTGQDGCIVESDDAGSWHWVRVDNVMVSTSDALADRTRTRLEAIAP